VEIPAVNRRKFLVGGAAASAATALGASGLLGTSPVARASTTAAPSDIQFDIGAFLAAPTTVNGIQVQFPPVHTLFVTSQLLRKPTTTDQSNLTKSMNALEQVYPWGASTLMTFIAYGKPYFNRLNQSIVSSKIPTVAGNTGRSALQEAVAGPTDVVSGNGITKLRYQVPVKIEGNDILWTLRSDNFNIIQDVFKWFAGSGTLNGKSVASPPLGGLMKTTSTRHMAIQQGLPRSVANQNSLPFASFVQPTSPMWMGFADQQTDSAGPAAITTFAGNASAHLTNAKTGDYFDNGSIQHLSHDIIDMLQWFDMDTPTSAPDDDGVFTERVQYMFHSPEMNPGNTDQLTDGGGPAFLPNQNRGPNYASQTAQGIGTDNNDHRIGHLSCLQRSSRASDGTPIHIRMDGPGFDNMDVPDGSKQPKLQFSVFVPTSDFFAKMRVSQGSQDLVNQFAIPDADNGLERFITATRRQNFLIPPRRVRSFPLIELGA
jgi:hypothetical protein